MRINRLDSDILNTNPELRNLFSVIKDMQREIAELKESNRELRLFKETLTDTYSIKETE